MGIENFPTSPMYNFTKRAEALTCPLLITSIKPYEKISGLECFTLSNFVIGKYC